MYDSLRVLSNFSTDLPRTSGSSNKSNDVSIVRLVKNESDSSEVDSDSECENIIHNQNIETNFGNITIQDSTDIRFGNFVCQAPVTINQFTCDEKQSKVSSRNGVSGFLNSSAVIQTNQVSDIVTESASLLRIISREEWRAEPPIKELDPFELPAIRVIIIHTVTSCPKTEMENKVQVRNIQDYHTDGLKFDDIGYNFLIGGDGAVYVGRGWDKQGAHTKGFNRKSIGIAFIGKFTRNKPEELQLSTAKKLLEEGVKLGKLDKNYRLYGHRQLKAAQSPGSALYSIITTWDHWSEEILPP